MYKGVDKSASMYAFYASYSLCTIFTCTISHYPAMQMQTACPFEYACWVDYYILNHILGCARFAEMFTFST